MEKHVERFGAAAASYENAGELQNYVAARLIEQIADQKSDFTVKPDILEIGCGTGFLTRRLRDTFGKAARYIITDASHDMVQACRESFNRATHMHFLTMDGQNISLPEKSMDLIASSMTIQWFDDPAASLEKWREHLKSNGSIHYATIGADNFAEWREHLEFCGLDFGMREMPEHLPGMIHEEYIRRDYGSRRGFLDMLKHTGAGTPKPDYKKPSPREFHKAVDSFDGEITWHIVYGSLNP